MKMATGRKNTKVPKWTSDAYSKLVSHATYRMCIYDLDLPFPETLAMDLNPAVFEGSLRTSR